MAPSRDIASLLSRRVGQLRAAKGWTQVRLATEAGVGRGTIATIESGHDTPSLRTIAALAAALGVPVAGLFLDPDRRPRDAFAWAVLHTPGDEWARAAEAMPGYAAAPKREKR